MLEKRFPLMLTVSMLMIALLIGCSSGENKDSANDDESQATEEEQNTEQERQQEEENKSTENDQEATKSDNTIVITATEMKFEPSQITLKKGQEYEFVLKNEGQVFHDFVEKELEMEMTFMSDMPDHPDQTSMIERLLGTKKAYAHGDEKHNKTLHMNAKPGQTVSIKFIPKETGEFEFYCSVPGHKEAGMKGTLIVEE